jgi:hypothetical protein
VQFQAITCERQLHAAALLRAGLEGLCKRVIINLRAHFFRSPHARDDAGRRRQIIDDHRCQIRNDVFLEIAPNARPECAGLSLDEAPIVHKSGPICRVPRIVGELQEILPVDSWPKPILIRLDMLPDRYGQPPSDRELLRRAFEEELTNEIPTLRVVSDTVSLEQRHEDENGPGVTRPLVVSYEPAPPGVDVGGGALTAFLCMVSTY